MQIRTQKLFCTLALPILLSSAAFQPTAARAEETAFTYQGRLNSGGAPANGSYDIAFKLYETNITGSAIAGPVTNSAISVSNGLFTTAVDFGPGIFTGTNYWLEIDVSTNGANAFTALTPRQPLTPTPYAIFASDASNLLGSVSTAQLTGAIPSGDISGNYSSQVNFNNGADTFDGTFFGQFLGNSFTGGTFTGLFIGDGSGLININPAHIAGQVAYLNSNQVFTAQNVFMQPVGLGNTSPSPFYNLDALSSQVGFRLQSTNSSNGAFVELRNTTSNNFSEYLGAINFNNAANSYPGQISYFSWPGGTAPDYLAFRVGGWDQAFKLVADTTGYGADSLINGYYNSADNTNDADFIGTGYGNVIHSGFSAIVDGNQNAITTNMPFSFIGGGTGNSINFTTTNVGYGYAAIPGGFQNQANAGFSFVGGGIGNTASGIGSAVLGGGVYQYTASNNLTYYITGTGARGISSTVLGGTGNEAIGDFSTAAGYISFAEHPGTFVWADSQFPTLVAFASTTSNEFSIRAQNGLRLVSDVGVHLNAADEPLIVRDWNVFGPNAPADKAGIGRWGLFMEPDVLTIGIPDTNLPDTNPRFFQVAKYATNGAYTTLMSVDQSGDAQLPGYLRLGSETNSGAPPLYPAGSPGLVIRRIACTVDAIGTLVARTDQLQLQRDGTESGLQMAYNTTLFQTINATGITTNGATVNYRNTIHTGLSGTLAIFTDSQKLVHYDISFGSIYNAGHTCHVVLDRYDDGVTSDYFLIGTMTTTYNQ